MHHHISAHNLKPQDVTDGGYRIKLTKSSFPALQGMSFYKLVLNEKGVREPHWHANADELGYCLKGKLLVSFFGNGNSREIFIVESGEVFFIPSGALHSIENIGKGQAEVLLQFSNEEPEDFGLSTVFGMFSDAVLGNTWDVEASHFRPMKRVEKETFALKLKESTPLTKEMHYTSSYKFSLEASQPPILANGGMAKVARNNVWPILRRQALYSLVLHESGMREPHWHPETAEMGYVAKGRGRMSIQSPSGQVDTYIMQEGDLYFIPKAYPHHIETLEKTDLHLLIFFDQPMPQDIGFTGSVKSFPDAVLSGLMQSKEEVFKALPIHYTDLFIVDKKKPLDK
ncbi:MAG: cupin domain-containing protein [Chlamydiia bacterium]|nr:cupin domain-containing protein [Chlamydiia bacterium]